MGDRYAHTNGRDPSADRRCGLRVVLATGIQEIQCRCDRKPGGAAKRTVYGYFRSKDDLLAAVLQRYEELAAERLKHIGDRLPADPIGLVDSFFGQLNEWASSTPRWSGSGFTRLVVELADLPGHPARTIARRAKGKTESWLAERLAVARVDNAQARAREIMLLVEGSMALTLIHGGCEYIDASARLAKKLMTNSGA
jgi:AcrR family transcriptional regulator